MAIYTETFQGSTIEIEDDRDLTIDGKFIFPLFDPVTQQWSTQYLPYSNYSSLLELARAIVRDTEEFTGQVNTN